jgi:formate dehydrogenase maturation protein FdhE
MSYVIWMIVLCPTCRRIWCMGRVRCINCEARKIELDKSTEKR